MNMLVFIILSVHEDVSEYRYNFLYRDDINTKRRCKVYKLFWVVSF